MNSVYLAQAQDAVRAGSGVRGGNDSSEEMGRGLNLEVKFKEEKRKRAWVRAFQSIQREGLAHST